MTHKKERLLALSLILIAAGATVVLTSNGRTQTLEAERFWCEKTSGDIQQATVGKISTTPNARSLFVYDFTNGATLAEKDATLPLPLASLTKLMTVRTALHLVRPDQEYTLTENDVRPLGSIGMEAGDTFSIQNLITAALIASSNDAALSIASATGLDQEEFLHAMEQETDLLGYDSMSFSTITGLDDALNNARAFGSARDVTFLIVKDLRDFPELMHVSIREKDHIESQGGRVIELENTDKALKGMPLLSASKTGYTDAAGGNLAVVWNTPSGRMVGATILGSTEEGRFTEMLSVYGRTNRYDAFMKNLPGYCATIHDTNS